ncbi:hypothetical protein Droror1_Dr00002391, partial [Drosera rotundifolia]
MAKVEFARKKDIIWGSLRRGHAGSVASLLGASCQLGRGRRDKVNEELVFGVEFARKLRAKALKTVGSTTLGELFVFKKKK